MKKRAVDVDGKPIGVANNNPLLDTREYVIEFEDGAEEIVSANVIAENILSQMNEEGHRQLMLYEIVDHRTTHDAIPKVRGYITTPSGARRKKRTTRGWKICVS